MTCNECAWIKGYEKTSFFGHRHCDYECSCLCHVMSDENGKSKYSNKVKNLLAEVIRRRDAYLLEKVEGMRRITRDLESTYRNRALEDIIKLIKVE